ncbi:MAG: hypothetical protein GY841_01505 [FCB group bacterium]|nr:hypothetical protein [FCB group bacterium]
MKSGAVVGLVLLTFGAFASGEIIPGQAVSWTDFSHITCLAVSSELAYFGTTEGILRYHRYENRWYDPITISDGLPGHQIRRIAVPFDDAWIAVETEEGVYTYESALERWFLDTEFPDEFYQDSRPRPPLPNMFMPFGFNFDPQGFISDDRFREWQVTAILDDQYSTLFIGSWGLGPLKSDNNDLEAKMISYGLLQKRTDAIYMDGDSIWLAGNAGETVVDYPNARFGVTLYDRTDLHFEYFEPRFLHGFDSEVIYDIDGNDKNIYFAGRHGLTIKPRREDRFFTLRKGDGLPDNQATALAAHGDTVWVGTARGLALYNSAKDSLWTVGSNILGDKFITTLKNVGEILFIGTSKGAYYINYLNSEIGRLKDPEGILGSEIRDINLDDQNILYVASSWGLSSIDLKSETAEPVPYIDEPGGVYAAAANHKYIAAAVEDGLVLIERKSGRVRKFSEDDGLLSIKINAIIVEGDYLWLGSEEGLTRFMWVNPERVD